MTDTKENIMGTLPIGKLLMKMSVPVILSMLVSTLYGVIDSIFVSRLGDNALTAMSLATPISSLIACITVGFSVGMNAELSKKLGEGDIDGANKAAGNGILVNWIVAGVFLILGLFFVPMFYRLQTDNAAIQRIGTDYTSIICIFSFGVANQVMFERMLVATGRSLGSMFSLLTGTIVNLILDPILIFGYFGAPEMGMKGAAIATVIAQFSAAAVAFGFNLKVNKEIHFHPGILIPKADTMKQIWNWIDPEKRTHMFIFRDSLMLLFSIYLYLKLVLKIEQKNQNYSNSDKKYSILHYSNRSVHLHNH